MSAWQADQQATRPLLSFVRTTALTRPIRSLSLLYCTICDVFERAFLHLLRYQAVRVSANRCIPLNVLVGVEPCWGAGAGVEMQMWRKREVKDHKACPVPEAAGDRQRREVMDTSRHSQLRLRVAPHVIVRGDNYQQKQHDLYNDTMGCLAAVRPSRLCNHSQEENCTFRKLSRKQSGPAELIDVMMWRNTLVLPRLYLAAQNVGMQPQHRENQAPIAQVLYGQAVIPRLFQHFSAQSCRSSAFRPRLRLAQSRCES